MLKYMLDGGSMMWPLLALSVVGLAVVLERWRVFQLASQDTTALRRMMFQLLGAGKIDDAIRLCEETRGPVAAVLLVGLNRYRKLGGMQRSKTEVEESVAKSMGDFAPHVISALDRRISLLLLVGSSAPLLGMTGTVTGMIRAFGAMATGGLSGNVVAAGIAEALITTAAGLVIAVPAVIAYNYFSTRLEQMTIRIEESANELVSYIHLREHA